MPSWNLAAGTAHVERLQQGRHSPPRQGRPAHQKHQLAAVNAAVSSLLSQQSQAVANL